MRPAKWYVKLAFLTVTVALLFSGCSGGGPDSGKTPPPAAKSSPPVANAGINQTTTLNGTVTLDGSRSTSTSGGVVSYNWSITSKPMGSNPALSDTSAMTTTFTSDKEGTYQVQLVVMEGQQVSQPSVVSITVTASSTNSAPVANITAGQTVGTGSTATLDGSPSSDADGDALNYAWTLIGKPSGSVATLTSTTGASSSFVPDLAGIYTVQLVVNDGKASSPAATVTITASTAQNDSILLTATGVNDASYSYFPKSYNGTDGSLAGVSSEADLFGSYGISTKQGQLEIVLSGIPAGRTIKKAVLHLYLAQVIQTYNRDPTLAMLIHFRDPDYTGDVIYDWNHFPGATASMASDVYTFTAAEQIGWKEFDVTSLIAGDLAAGCKCATFYVLPTSWIDTIDKTKSKGVIFVSADAYAGAYAPYLEVQMQ